jgi:hypothetical protein
MINKKEFLNTIRQGVGQKPVTTSMGATVSSAPKKPVYKPGAMNVFKKPGIPVAKRPGMPSKSKPVMTPGQMWQKREEMSKFKGGTLKGKDRFLSSFDKKATVFRSIN